MHPVFQGVLGETEAIVKWCGLFGPTGTTCFSIGNVPDFPELRMEEIARDGASCSKMS